MIDVNKSSEIKPVSICSVFFRSIDIRTYIYIHLYLQSLIYVYAQLDL